MTNKTLVRIRVWIRAWIKIYIRTRNYYRVLNAPRFWFFFGVRSIEIINNTRVAIEAKKRERGYWGANSSPGCSLIHDDPDKKSRFRRVFLLFEMFFLVKILKISFQIVSNNKSNLKSTILPTKPAKRPQQR